MTKKILLFLILLSALPLAQLQAQTVYTHPANGKTWSYTVNGGNATITGVSPATGELNIPAKVGPALEYDVTAIRNNAFYNNKNITKLTANSVTTIGNTAFQYCTGLTGLELPNVTTIGVNAFRECTSITSLELPKVTNVGNAAFFNCSGLTGKLELPNVVTIGYSAFTNCSGLTGKLELPNVTTIGNSAFQNCSGLTTLDLPSVTTIGNNTFQNCSGLTGKLELPNVITIGNSAFQVCTGLTSLELPNVTTIGNSAFYICSGLTGLELPKVTTISNTAFYNCSGLTGKLELPNVTTIGNSAFWGCGGLTALNLPKVTSLGFRAFFNCRGLTGKLELPKTLTSIDDYAFYQCLNIDAITFESGTNLTSIGIEVFALCPSLLYIDMANVTLPPGITITKINSNSFFTKTQLYTMVYLPASAPAAAADEENFVRGNTCNQFVVYDYYTNYKQGLVGGDYYNSIIYPFTATRAEYRNRSFSYHNCKTICLPYKATLPNGMRAYKLVAKTRGGKAFRFVSVGDGNGTFQIDANTPYLIRIIDNNNYTNKNWRSNNVPVVVTPATIEVALADGQTFFGGTMTNIDNATAASNNYYNLENNTWRPIKTTDTNGYVHSMRAYIRTTGGTPAKGFAMVLDDDDKATTDIDNAAELTEDELKNGKHTFYTIDGRRAGTNYDTLKSGEMYVVKGQKFYKF